LDWERILKKYETVVEQEAFLQKEKGLDTQAEGRAYFLGGATSMRILPLEKGRARSSSLNNETVGMGTGLGMELENNQVSKNFTRVISKVELVSMMAMSIGPKRSVELLLLLPSFSESLPLDVYKKILNVGEVVKQQKELIHKVRGDNEERKGKEKEKKRSKLTPSLSPSRCSTLLTVISGSKSLQWLAHNFVR
jgi:hypothetical protein